MRARIYKLVVGFLGLVWPFCACASVEILQINCNPVGKDSDYEWIKIKNTSTTTVDLSGWKVSDNGVLKNIEYTDTLLPGEQAYIARNKDKLDFPEKIFQASFSLSNKQDKIALVDKDGNIVDEKSYNFSSSVKEGEFCYPAESSSDTEDSNSTVDVKDYKVVFKTVTIQPAPKLELVLQVPEYTTAGAQTEIYVYAYNSKGEVVEPTYSTNTGDGKLYTAPKFFHIYKSVGEYLVHSRASLGQLNSTATKTIKVLPVEVELYANRHSLFIKNKATSTLNLSGYTVYTPVGKMRFPINTFVVSNQSLQINFVDWFGNKLDLGNKILLKDANLKTIASTTVSLDKSKKDTPKTTVHKQEDVTKQSASLAKDYKVDKPGKSLSNHEQIQKTKSFKPNSKQKATKKTKPKKLQTNQTTSTTTAQKTANKTQNHISFLAGIIFAALASVVYVLLG